MEDPKTFVLSKRQYISGHREQFYRIELLDDTYRKESYAASLGFEETKGDMKAFGKKVATRHYENRFKDSELEVIERRDTITTLDKPASLTPDQEYIDFHASPEEIINFWEAYDAEIKKQTKG